MELDFPRGPWQRLFKGEWSGTEVHLFKNPESHTLTAVEDREDGELQGFVLFLNKYFVVAGDVSKLNTELGGYSLLFEENYPTQKGRFFSLSTGPQYTKPETKKIDAKVEEMFQNVHEKEKKLQELSKKYQVDLTELKNISEEEESLLFKRPVLLPALLTGKEEKEIEPEKGKLLLGKKQDGLKAEETIDKFKATTIIGEEKQRQKAIHLLLENCVLAGVNGVIFDDSNRFKSLSSPNPKFPHQEYPGLQPIGLPVRNLKPGEIQIDLNQLDKKAFREVINVPDEENEYAGKKTAEMIDEIISNDKKLKSLKDIEEELTAVKEDVKTFHKYRGVRWMKVLNQIYPDFMDGEMDLRSMVSAYLQSMGTVIRIDTSALPSNLKRAFAYSFLKTLYEENKQEGFQKRLRALVILPHAKTYTPAKPTERLNENILEILTNANSYGIGYAVGAKNEINIYQPLLKETTLRQDFVKDNQVAVKKKEGKPYRVNLRPYLTQD